MLVELRIEQLGVIDEVTVVFGDGLTVLTGETGAGKTMIVEAINLLVGQRADASMVRAALLDTRLDRCHRPARNAPRRATHRHPRAP
ncbi:MAG: hypothetical protein EBY86_08270 [Acidimicrobiia bacterium]|nr:hypothetical protein [Acidimicrobiia bacterium]